MTVNRSRHIKELILMSLCAKYELKMSNVGFGHQLYMCMHICINKHAMEFCVKRVACKCVLRKRNSSHQSVKEVDIDKFS